MAFGRPENADAMPIAVDEGIDKTIPQNCPFFFHGKCFREELLRLVPLKNTKQARYSESGPTEFLVLKIWPNRICN